MIAIQVQTSKLARPARRAKLYPLFLVVLHKFPFMPQQSGSLKSAHRLRSRSSPEPVVAPDTEDSGHTGTLLVLNVLLIPNRTATRPISQFDATYTNVR
jgi:hypothetical protein